MDPSHPSINRDTLQPSGAATPEKLTPVIEPDPVQPGEIRLHSWMLYIPQAPVLDLREETFKTITSTLDLRNAFHQLQIYAKKRMRSIQNSELIAEGNPKSPKVPLKN